ncbi:MAG: deoxyribonuclease IV [Patescibacteria group bacterium]|nr:deoxyribonuclease IV [Patescibacteria group bacterium]
MTELKIGAHLSVSGGYESALERIVAMGGNALQIFSTSPRIWKPATVSDVSATAFRKRAVELGVGPVFFHASYLINLADSERIGAVSKTALIAELRLQPRMGVSGSVVHLGSYKDKGYATDGLFMHEKYPILLGNIREILAETPEESILIIENVATRKIGRTLEELGQILSDINSPRVRVCLDTCHLHAAGYDLSTAESFQAFMATVDSLIGWNSVALFHLNDSRDPFGSFRDRHENLGEGLVPKSVFLNLLNHPRLQTIPAILETPGFDGNGPDARNITIARSFINHNPSL